MYVTTETIQELQRRYGTPETAAFSAPFQAREFELMERCGRKGRAHDVTLIIRNPEDGRIALIRKPSYPPEVFRPPSGGVEPDEPFETGARREAREETGLEVSLERYLLRVDARFTCDGREAPWVTHVFSAARTGGDLEPLDRGEIADARWATVDEVFRTYRPAMLAIGSEGMRYRVFLQDTALRLLGYEGMC
jgi:ADP-ribose pyrophosphatase YjhB (NUDIX family)